RDNEGSLYATFKTLNFIACRVEDDSANIIFRGYIVKKLYKHNQMILQMRGIGAVLEWKFFTNSYISAEGDVASVPVGANLVLKDNDEGNPLEWSNDQWHIGDQNKALLIVDNTGSTISKTWDSSAIDVTGQDGQVGNNASTLALDADILELQEDGEFHDVAVEFTIDGDVFPDSTFLQAIEITYRFAMRLDSHNPANGVYGEVALQIKKTTTWKTKRIFVMDLPGVNDQTFWYTDTIRIEGSDAALQTYLDKIVNDYASLKGLRLVSSGNSSGNPALDEFYLHVDYISVEVFYNTSNISPLMAQITDNGVTSVTCNGIADWSTTGVSINDGFFIGENTTKVLSDLSASMGITFSIQSTLTKYIARWYKGTLGIEVLQSIILLEGIHFYEDYINNKIVIISADDFPSSGITLDSTDYEWDWEYEDDCNNYYRVEVYGSASLRVFAYAEDEDVDSPMIKQIIDETIMTVPDAQEVADAQLALWKVKRESIKIPLDGVNEDLQLGTTVELLMGRPTVYGMKSWSDIVSSVIPPGWDIRMTDTDRVHTLNQYINWYVFVESGDNEGTIYRVASSIATQPVQLVLTTTPPLNLIGDVITMYDPDYPIRMIERSKRGIGGIETIIYCGLGHSTIEEEIGSSINYALALAHKAHTYRLISSPLSSSAIITWSDVGGRVTGVEVIITAELVDGQSIDNAIDALILTHKNIASAHHNEPSDLEYSSLWEAITNVAPSKHVTYDAIEALRNSMLGINFFLHQDASADVGGYRLLDIAFPDDAKTEVFNVTVTSDDQEIEQWVTPSGIPELESLMHGIYHMHFHAYRFSGTKDV
ncbi:hypothetical protein LCGC14_1889210, partial [marine sediment metagenome]